MPKIEIVNVETMVIADSLMGTDKGLELSGVNLIFLAPEYYYSEDFDWSMDVWSIGAIIYLLITGGVRHHSHQESFDFREPIWRSAYMEDSSVLDFVEDMMQAKP